MRTRNEKILLAIMLTIVFAGLNYFGYTWLATHQKAMQLSAAQLQGDQADAKADLAESGMWAQRQTWVSQHEPTLGNAGDAGAQVLQDVLKGARDNKLEIQEQSLNDVQHGAAGTRVNVSVKVKGSMEGLVHWLTALQKPEQFYAVAHFSLKADQDQKSMVCELQLARYFKE